MGGKRHIVVLCAALVVLAGATSSFARDRVMLVGSSLTDGIRPMLRSIARSAGRDVFVKVRAVDHWTLADHASSRATLKKLQSTSWDYVVLQEQSLGMFASRYPAARALDAEIAGAGARTVFFMTWRDRDADLATYDSLLGVPGGDIGYVPIAYELGAILAPVGWAFRDEVVEDPAASLWSIDGHHSSDRGRYLAALVLFASIYGESPVGLWASAALSPDEALQDQLLVEQLVLGNALAWNVVPADAATSGSLAP